MSKKNNGGLTTILGRKIDFKNAKNQVAVKVLYEKNHSKFNEIRDSIFVGFLLLFVCFLISVRFSLVFCVFFGVCEFFHCFLSVF